MTRDELILALQKCPSNVEVVIDDPHDGKATSISSVGVARCPNDSNFHGKIVFNLVEYSYVGTTITDRYTK